ncbi:MAG: response regulator transcription factor [Erysipelotrichaceae bacterium]
MKKSILIVEDQPEIALILEKYARKEGFDVLVAVDGFQALSTFASHTIHLVLLDVMMPGIDGFEVLKNIRQTSEVPVLMLTAKVEEADRLKGFDLGVDDYVLKPFSAREVMKRIHAIIKRVYPKVQDTLDYLSLSLDIKAMKCYKNHEEIELTSVEFSLLRTLMEHRGQVLSREQLIEQSFGDRFEGYDRSMDTYIKRLRQKIEADPKNPVYIKTKYGAGYIFGEGGL